MIVLARNGDKEVAARTISPTFVTPDATSLNRSKMGHVRIVLRIHLALKRNVFAALVCKRFLHSSIECTA